jgi:hypothetical protein
MITASVRQRSRHHPRSLVIENKGFCIKSNELPLIPYQNSSYIDVELHFGALSTT